MTKQHKVATIFGGTGFIGQQIVRELAAQGVTIKVATRFPESAYFLRPCGVVGQIVPFACDYSDPKSIENAVDGSDYVVNCIGILYEKRKNSFNKVHTDIPREIAKACKKKKVGKFVHISALGADRGTSRYAKSKLAGEKAVHKNFKDATILRPSVVFGPDDNFFNMFAELARYFPALPLIGGGKTKFQPVYVGDVSDAVIAALHCTKGDDGAAGQIYELGGPDVVNFKEVYEIIFKATQRRRALIPLPWCVAKLEASVLQLLPKPLLTRDQVESLKTDNVVADDMPGLEALGIDATSLKQLVPTYLERYRPGGAFAEKAA